jgi:hypothetical protein
VSIAATIAHFSTGAYTVTRAAQGSYSSGRYVAAATAQLNIDASVQPLTGRQLRSLPEAFHSENTKAIYTSTLLRTRTPTTAPDIVAIGGENYEVFQVDTWTLHGATHYEVLAALVVTSTAQSLEMQSNQEQSFQFTTLSETDSYVVTMPVEMVDASYVVNPPAITTLPVGGVMCAITVDDSSKTTTQFTITCGFALKVGTVLDIEVRDHA